MIVVNGENFFIDLISVINAEDHNITKINGKNFFIDLISVI